MTANSGRCPPSCDAGADNHLCPRRGVESKRIPPAALKGKSRQVRRYAIDGTRGAPGRSLPSGGGRCRATAGDGRGIRRQQPGDTIRNARRGNGDEPGERRAAKTNVGPHGHTMRRSRRRPDGGIGITSFLLVRAMDREPVAMFLAIAIVVGVYGTTAAVFGALMLGRRRDQETDRPARQAAARSRTRTLTSSGRRLTTQ